MIGRILALLWFLSCASHVFAQSTVITVGPGASAGLPTRDHTDLCDAIDAATASTSSDPANYSRIDIDGADSSGNQIVYYDNNCEYGKSIHIKGVGSQRPALDRTPTFAIGGAHGYLRPSAGHQTLENLEGRNSRCNLNCTIIWPESLNVKSFTLKNVKFHDNDDNFLTGNQVMASTSRDIVVTVENSEFYHGGIWDGQSHCFYVGEIHTLIVKDSYIHDCFAGQAIKSRAGYNYITNNKIIDRRSSGYATSSTTNYGLDFPNGGLLHVTGNILSQGENVPPAGLPNGNAHVMVSATEKPARDAAGAVNEHQELYITYNTFTSRRSGAIFIRDFNVGSTRIIKNNLFAGSSADEFWDNNSVEADPADNCIYSSLAAANFVNATALDFRLGATSTAIDAAVTIGSVGTSPWSYNHENGLQYAHPRSTITRTQQGAALDCGALERGVDGTAYIEPPYVEKLNGSGKVTVFWGQTGHENNPPTGYSVYRDATLVTTIAASAESYDDTGGTPGVAYTYTVIAEGSPDSTVSNSVLAGSQRTAATTIGSGTGWHFISNSNFATNGCTPAGACTTYWTANIAGAAWDQSDRRFFVFGGDFSARNKNAVYYFDTELTPLVWVKANSDDTLPGGEYDSTGQRPSQRYVYGGLSWADSANKLVMVGGYFGAWSPKTWEWTESGDVWDDYASAVDLDPLDVYSTAYRPSNGKVWTLSPDAILREYDPSTHSSTSVKTGVSSFSFTRYLVAAESINKLFLVGQQYLGYFDLANNYAQTSVTHTSCEVQNIQSYPAVDFDSSTGKLVIWNRLDTILTYDPNTGTCSKQTIVGEPAMIGQMPSNGFRYDSSRDGFWAIANNNNVAFLRLTAESTAACGNCGGGSFSGGGSRQ